METAPDEAMAPMAAELAAGTRKVAEALKLMAAGDHEAATRVADQAVAEQRQLQHTYRAAMSALVGVDDMREISRPPRALPPYGADRR